MTKFLVNVLFLFISLAVSSGYAYSQITLPFAFTSEDDNRLIRESDSVKYYVATGDTTKVVSLNEDLSYYKLFNSERKIIAEGNYLVEGERYFMDGKWTERYENGKTKFIGYYHRGKPIGTWQEYSSTGKLIDVYNYGIFINNGEYYSCLSGTYQEFYPSGKLKINGFYSASLVEVPDTIMTTDPVTGAEKATVTRHSDFHNAKTGRWEYYTETGELEKKQDY